MRRLFIGGCTLCYCIISNRSDLSKQSEQTENGEMKIESKNKNKRTLSLFLRVSVCIMQYYINKSYQKNRKRKEYAHPDDMRKTKAKKNRLNRTRNWIIRLFIALYLRLLLVLLVKCQFRCLSRTVFDLINWIYALPQSLVGFLIFFSPLRFFFCVYRTTTSERKSKII